MRERPVIMSGESVRAILAGQKTQTRRVLTPQPPPVDPAQPYHLAPRVARSVGTYSLNDYEHLPKEPGAVAVFGAVSYVRDACGRAAWRCPYGVPGDRLWVKEGFLLLAEARGYQDAVQPPKPVIYRADEGDSIVAAVANRQGARWRSPLFMPRWASRLTLAITQVRVERLQDISAEDALAEGYGHDVHAFYRNTLPIRLYRRAWDHLNGKRGFPWDGNWYVWVVSFAPPPQAAAQGGDQ